MEPEDEATTDALCLADEPYFLGYPRAHLHQCIRIIKIQAVCSVPFVGFAAVNAWVYYLEVASWAGLPALSQALAALGPALVCLGCLVILVTIILQPGHNFRGRLVPYFERPLGGVDTWRHGFSLARHCRELDRLAARLGVCPLSHLGLRRDQGDERDPHWLAPELGEETVEALIVHLEEADLADDVLEQTRRDLGRLLRGLRRASEEGCRFQLVLRHGGGEVVSPMEMDLLPGSFW